MNVLSAIGRLGADPELRTTRTGTSVLELRVCIDTRVKRGDEWIPHPSWVRCSLFGKRAESLARMLHKGDRIGITGALMVRDYETKTGGKGTSVEVVDVDIHLLGSRDGGGQRAPSARDFGGSGGGGFDDFPADDGDDIPFARCDIDTRRPHDPTRGVL